MRRDLDLYLPVMLAGACAMAVEIAGARIIAPYLGNTIYTWSAVIGFVLAALSVGYFYGGKLGDKYGDEKHLSYIFIIAAACTIGIPFLAIIFVPMTVVLEIIPASIISSLILVPAGFFYGMVTPYAIKLTTSKGEEGRSAGNIFAISTIGSIFGVLLTGFLLIPNIFLSHVFILAAVLMLVSGWLINRKQITPIEIMVFIVGSLLISGISYSPSFEGTVIHQENSEYYLVSVMEIEGGRLLLLDRALETGEKDGEPIFKYVKKTKIAYELLDNPENALVLGVGGGTHVEDLKEEFPEIEVDGVEIDASVIKVGKEFFSLKDERTTIIIDDARRYVLNSDKRYDVIIVDVYRGTTMPYHLSSLEFVKEMKEDLKEDGVIVTNIISSLEGEKSKRFELFYNTFNHEFENVLTIPTNDKPTEIQNILVIATDGNVNEFKEKHYLYEREITDDRIVTDEWNPMDVMVAQ